MDKPINGDRCARVAYVKEYTTGQIIFYLFSAKVVPLHVEKRLTKVEN